MNISGPRLAALEEKQIHLHHFDKNENRIQNQFKQILHVNITENQRLHAQSTQHKAYNTNWNATLLGRTTKAKYTSACAFCM